MSIPISTAKPNMQQGIPTRSRGSARLQRRSQELLPRRLLKLIGQLWQQQKKISWTSVLLCAGLIVAITGAAAQKTQKTLVPPMLYIQRLMQLPSKTASPGTNLPHLLPVMPHRDNVA